jgi:HlyD family secretion protein
MRKSIVIFVLVLLVVASAGGWWWTHRASADGELQLFGNVDLRQADLAFNNSERIAWVLVQEGDHVKKGDVLAILDTSRLEPQYHVAQAQADAQRAMVDRLHNGNRPEEIAQAKANLDAAKADAANAKRQYERVFGLSQGGLNRAVSQQDVDNAQAVLDVASAKVEVNQKAYDLEVIGPRKEDIAQAEAMLRADEAQVNLLHQQLNDYQLFAPQDGVIRSRLMEPGEMATPQKPVFSVAIVDPKWVRAYVSETDLGKIHPGAAAWVTVDSFPNRKFSGWIGFISPEAEFTPKAVQTEELRTSLVYEVRAFVNDPNDELRLGMPATVTLSNGAKSQMPATAPTTQPQ